MPVFFDFDRPITADLLIGLIRQVESAGALVTCIVSDLGPTNRALWRALGISNSSRTSFTNPADLGTQQVGVTLILSWPWSFTCSTSREIASIFFSLC